MSTKNILVVIPVNDRHMEYLAEQAAGGQDEYTFIRKPAAEVITRL